MKAEIVICDWCRSDGDINSAVGYYWDRRLGRMLDVCYQHLQMVLDVGVAAGLFTHPGAVDESLFILPNCGVFCEAEVGKW
jgi:hypothetical protein